VWRSLGEDVVRGALADGVRPLITGEGRVRAEDQLGQLIANQLTDPPQASRHRRSGRRLCAGKMSQNVPSVEPVRLPPNAG
jgi:hypothetical protein